MAGRRVTGVRYRVDGERRSAQAAAKSFSPPAPSARRPSCKCPASVPPRCCAISAIEVRHDLPGVGENLQDHWMLRIQHRLENTVTLSGWMNSPFGKAALGLQYFLARRGPLSAQPTLLAVFARTLPGLDIPDVQIHVSAASYAHVGGPLHPFPGMTSSACILRPTSRGHVRIRSSSAAEPPSIRA